MDLAKVQAAEVVAERIAQVAEGILSAIELSLTKITDTIMVGPLMANITRVAAGPQGRHGPGVENISSCLASRPAARP